MVGTATEGIVSLAGGGFDLEVWPAVGGGLIRARATVGGRPLVLTRRVDDDALAARDVRRLGGFVMAPYCNRIVGGHFVDPAGEVRVPLNWPADPGVAIHGLSWRLPWTIEERTADQLVIAQSVTGSADQSYSYDAVLTYDLSSVADAPTAVITLALTNRARRPMSFGLGFHPYLRRATGAVLTFQAGGQLVPDARCLPTHWRALDPAERADAGRPVEAFAGIDAAFTEWPQTVSLSYPDAGARLTLNASTSARLLHVYVPAKPAGPAFLCLEPVSHVIDVANRREFAAYGDMTMLAPSATLAMSMTWRVDPL